MCTFCYLSPISAMLLPQTTNFFFTMYFFLFLFTTLQNKNIVLVFCVLFFCFCLHHFRIRILYLSLQRVSQNNNNVLKITLSIYQGTFTIKERDKPNCFSERLIICILFFISLLYFGMPLPQTNCNKIFFFHPIQIHSHIDFFKK